MRQNTQAQLEHIYLEDILIEKEIGKDTCKPFCELDYRDRKSVV